MEESSTYLSSSLLLPKALGQHPDRQRQHEYMHASSECKRGDRIGHMPPVNVPGQQLPPLWTPSDRSCPPLETEGALLFPASVIPRPTRDMVITPFLLADSQAQNQSLRLSILQKEMV